MQQQQYSMQQQQQSLPMPPQGGFDPFAFAAAPAGATPFDPFAPAPQQQQQQQQQPPPPQAFNPF